MTAADLLLLAGLALFLVAWCWPALDRLLWPAAWLTFGAGLYGVWDDRWQAGLGAAVGALWLLVLAFRRRRTGLPLWSGLLFFVLGVLALAPLWLFPVNDLPPPDGPYAVGVRDFELVDPSRRGLLGAAADAPRRLLVRVWYPAAPTPGTQPRAYFSEAEARTTARGFGSLFGFPPLLAHLKHVRSNAFEDAPLAAGVAKLPVVFFSHGYTAYPAADSALMEALASHGYAVYSIQHSGDASPTPLPDGSVAPMDPGLLTHMRHVLKSGFPAAMVSGYTASDFDQRLDGQLRTAAGLGAPGDRAITLSAPVWLADRLFVHDALQAGAAPASVADLLATSDFARTGEMGMSFGGSTTGAVCMVDRRCAAAVNLDGGDFHFTPFDADLPVPLLMFHADLRGFYRMLGVEPKGELRGSNDFSYERFEHAGQRDDIYRLVLRDALHAGFTDNALLARRPLRDLVAGTAPVEVLIGAPNAFVVGFFDRYLRGLDSGFPQAQYARYPGWVTRHDNRAVRDWWLAKPTAEREGWERRIVATKATRADGSP
ncbi:dienelactone hydrolase [Pseudomonas jinjuensis]|nr:dienelactone hydrolase [Pseudomonas jinjuensis]